MLTPFKSTELFKGDRSIDHFQAELDLALYRVGAGDGAKVLISEGCITGSAEIRVIERIEQLRTELELDALRDGEVLEDREIHIDEAWAIEKVAASGAENKGRRQSERGGVNAAC